MSFRTLFTAVLVAVCASSVAGAAAFAVDIPMCQKAILASPILTAVDASACHKVLGQYTVVTGSAQGVVKGSAQGAVKGSAQGVVKGSAHVVVPAKVTAQVDVNLNPFVNFMSSCGSLTTGLSDNLNSALSAVVNIGGGLIITAGISGDARADLLQQRAIQAIVSLRDKVQASLGALVNIAPCNDDNVAAATYETFRRFVATQQRLLAMISTHADVWGQFNFKDTLYRHLVDLQVSLNAYVGQLFRYIPIDLDNNLNLRAGLFISTRDAINACA